MGETLLSVGLDVGTTTTQMIVSRLTVENQASGFAVPKMQITGREILYKSPVHFTPLLGENRVDGQAIRTLVEEDYRLAGITPREVDTGAVIITGETSRKENAQAVLENLSAFAGDFVVTTAGPHLESVLAAKGAGAMEASQNTHLPVLHIDIGGGTSNLCFIQNGEILRTGCLNVGGRLIKRDTQGRITYVSPVLQGKTALVAGVVPTASQLEETAALLCSVLCQAAGRSEETELLGEFSTQEAGAPWQPPDTPVLVSLSGGVAQCVEKEEEENAFGDLGPLLGKAIRRSVLYAGGCRISQHAIRCTVIGAGCHSTQLSGSTVFWREIKLPLKNLSVEVFTLQQQNSEDFSSIIEKRLQKENAEAVLALPGYESPDYGQVKRLAEKIAAGCPNGVYVCLQQDMAKALGNALQMLLPQKPILCLDGLAPQEQSYLDVGLPVGPCIPVVIKTLVFRQREPNERGSL